MARRRILITIATLTVLPAVTFPVARFAYVTRRTVDAWQREHSGPAVIGKTPEELTARFGEPYFLDRDPGTGRIVRIGYAGPACTYCSIEFQQGVANRVTFWGK